VLTTSVIEHDTKFSVYPNPVKNILNIQGIDNMQQIEVISVTGSVMKKQPGAASVDVSDLKRGVYFLKVHTDNAIITTRFRKD
jgi:serine protease AprX